MIELLAAMAVLMIGLFAIFAMFESSSRTIKRASTVSTASALADAQLEGFRAKLYADIGLVDSQVTAATAPYSSDPAYDADAADRVDLPACGSSPCTTSVPVQTLTGADGRSYRVDTYVTWQTVSNGTATGRDVKLVTIVVRDADDTTKVWTRVSSSFDESTGT
jgi:Tfp pilus assembly protein PilV